MKFHVTNLFRIAATSTFILLSYSMVGGQSNVCNCPNPPGTVVKCDANQYAFCNIKDGQVVSTCITPDPRSRETARIKALSIILGKEVTSEEVLGNSLFGAILNAQGLRTDKSAITFSVPDSTENGKTKLKDLPKVTDPTLSEKVDRFSSDQFPRRFGNRMSHSPPPPNQ